MLGVITRYEASRLVRAPQTWVLFALVAGLLAWLFLSAVDAFVRLQPTLATQDHAPGLTGFVATRFLASAAVVLAVLCPLLAMRGFSDEQRQGTMPLWLSAPVSSTTLVLGKYLGLVLVLLIPVVLAVGMPLGMAAFVRIDIGVLLSALLGLMLCVSAFTAIGLFFSSLTSQPLIAIIASLMLILLLWLLGSVQFQALPLQFLSLLGPPAHLAGFFQGYLSSGAVAYFVLLAGLFVVLSVLRLDALRHVGR